MTDTAVSTTSFRRNKVDIIQEVEKNYRKPEIPDFKVGDTVDVPVRIKEGEKERIQTFTGVVIAIGGKGINRTFTVRRTVQGEGVERTFPYHSPKVGEVKVKKSGIVRRAKLYYLRDRTGKGARIKEMTGMRLAKSKKKAAEIRQKNAERLAEQTRLAEQAQHEETSESSDEIQDKK